MKIELQQNIWNGRTPVEIEFPDDWDVKCLDLPADKLKKITREQIRYTLEHPIGAKPLSEQAVGKKKVCIVFDDASRPTPAGEIAEVALEILLEAGVKKSDIFFLCAPGSHGVHNRKQFADKLGEKIVDEYLILNHNCHENCECVGASKEGFRIEVNKEFLDSDLRIGIGCIMPHSMCGFGGGYRLLIPGICSLDTMEHVHRAVSVYMSNVEDFWTLTGHKENMFMHNMIADCGRKAGDFFKIDCIVNSKIEIVDLYAGDALEEYKEAAKAGEKLLTLDCTRDEKYDVVVCNANAKTSYALEGILPITALLGKDGTAVLVNFAIEGQIAHYLRGYWGEKCLPRHPMESGGDVLGRFKFRYFSPYGDYNAEYALHYHGEKNFKRVKTWEEILKELCSDGVKKKVCVVTEATLCVI